MSKQPHGCEGSYLMKICGSVKQEENILLRAAVSIQLTPPSSLHSQPISSNYRSLQCLRIYILIVSHSHTRCLYRPPNLPDLFVIVSIDYILIMLIQRLRVARKIFLFRYYRHICDKFGEQS